MVVGKKVALIIGVTGQDGQILADILLKKQYKVHGVRPYGPEAGGDYLASLISSGLHLHYGDLGDTGSLLRLLADIRPDEIYNLGALSHVHVSFSQPEATANINALGPVRLIEAIRALGMMNNVRVYQASSSEMFGRSAPPQRETTAFQPCSPYACAKLYAYWMMRNAREAEGLYACNGILFNHESTLRGEEFVTRKITRTIGDIEAGHRDILYLGNLEARRDWGHAHDYMRGAWMMLQQDKPDDYVLATGVSYTVREFVSVAFACIGIKLTWQGQGMDERGVDCATGRVLVTVDPALFRPQEVHVLLGDAAKARRVLGWTPKIAFAEMVADMVEADRHSPARYAHG
jgi:GDPmannose 4,6-dehydratase